MRDIFLCFPCGKLLSDSPSDSQGRDSSVGKLMSFQHKFLLETLHSYQRQLLREIEREDYCYHGNIPERTFIFLSVLGGTSVSLYCLCTCC